ncbi:Proteasome subunit beta type-4 [Kappamyces sp. JEL0829]|nr:Proteasome subunit beta type-4 [Kappamyces sp. JEL0829]KAJ3372359.1 Proteasome subunit beta type-4 [Kappamyces sp. JEL0680]
MEVLLGITGKDFVLTASDAVAARSIVLMKIGEDKSRALNSHSLLVYSGESGDTVQFAEYIQKNIQLSTMRHGVELSPTAVAHFVRREMADSLRTRNAYHVNVMVAGTDPNTSIPSLYWIDHLSSMCQLNFAAHGYASYFCMSTMDRYWKPDMTLPEAKALLQKCLDELKVRFLANLPEFTIKVVTKDGIEKITL